MTHGRTPGGVAFRVQPETYSGFYPTQKPPSRMGRKAIAIIATLGAAWFAAVGMIATGCVIAGGC